MEHLVLHVVEDGQAVAPLVAGEGGRDHFEPVAQPFEKGRPLGTGEGRMHVAAETVEVQQTGARSPALHRHRAGTHRHRCGHHRGTPFNALSGTRG